MVSEAVLQSIPLFQGLKAEELGQVAQYITQKDYVKNELIFTENTGGRQLYIIKSGVVRISKVVSGKEEQNLTLLKEGEFFGELSLLDGKPHTANAVAWKDCQILTLGKDQFEKFLAEDPQSGYQLLERILIGVCGLLRQMDEKFIDMIKFVWEFGAKT